MDLRAAAVAPPEPIETTNDRLRAERDRAAATERRRDAAPALLWHILSEREQQVLRLKAHGLQETECADRLGLTPRTVKAYSHQARQKLGARNTIEALLVSGLLVWNPDLEGSPVGRHGEGRPAGGNHGGDAA